MQLHTKMPQDFDQEIVAWKSKSCTEKFFEDHNIPWGFGVLSIPGTLPFPIQKTPVSRIRPNSTVSWIAARWAPDLVTTGDVVTRGSILANNDQE
jgi:hypothetical protein